MLFRSADTIRLELNQPPEGIAIQDVETVRDGVAIVLRADAAKVKAGLKGNLIVDAYMERAANPDARQPTVRRRVPLGTLPAIPFEIVENHGAADPLVRAGPPGPASRRPQHPGP